LAGGRIAEVGVTDLTEARDACEEARKLQRTGHTALALAELDVVTGDAVPLVLADHPVIAACHALKAEILRESGASEEVHLAPMAHALDLCDRHLADDFEGVAPVLLNGLRYYLSLGRRAEAIELEKKLLTGCEQFHGPGHPRYYQLRQWIADART
jgi:hypothetical protein